MAEPVAETARKNVQKNITTVLETRQKAMRQRMDTVKGPGGLLGEDGIIAQRSKTGSGPVAQRLAKQWGPSNAPIEEKPLPNDTQSSTTQKKTTNGGYPSRA